MHKRNAAAELPRLQERLALNGFMCRLFGLKEIDDFQKLLRQLAPGWHDDGHSYFYHSLAGLTNLDPIVAARLPDYDLRLKEYTTWLNRHRSNPVRLLYFQYLAALFAEIYLDRLTDDRASLLSELNLFGSSMHPAVRFRDGDLSKLAFWMATGSGKTLIMHINLWQFAHYALERGLRYDNVLLITPNEGLSRQHMEELRRSGIRARRHGEAGTGGLLIGDDVTVTVIEITKLTASKRGGGLSVEVDAFGPHNLLLVDEGHRGASGEVWRKLRERVAERGFTFEYSATFGQIVNGASPQRDKATGRSKRETLLDEYAKAILFDYSYPHFYQDGYGKDYAILNLKDTTNSFNDWMMLGNLLSFYEQSVVFEHRRESFRAYNIEPPLWVFVGHSVTGGKSKKTEDDTATLTDMEQVVAFFDDFLRHLAKWTKRIEQVMNRATGLKNADGEDIFGTLFPFLRNRRLSASELYDGIMECVFRAQAGETLRTVAIADAPGEIGLRVGADRPCFGVINIGDVPGLLKLFEKNNIAIDEEKIGGSLFDQLGASDSTVNVLIGSRKFMEGWDSFRVSSMGLLNIGKGEGAQIIQLFGRGVRLHGTGYSLKRSKELDRHDPAPPHIGLLETLNIFGVRANYMAQFRDHLREEGVETDLEEVVVPIKLEQAFLQRGLQMLRRKDTEDFRDAAETMLRVDDAVEVTLDLRPRFEMATSASEEERAERVGASDQWDEVRNLATFFNWDRVYFEMLTFKRAKELHNVNFTHDILRDVVNHGRCHLHYPCSQQNPTSFARLRRAEDMAVGVLRKYFGQFYDRRRREWEQRRVTLAPLAADDPNLAFGGYRVRAKGQFVESVRKLLRKADDVYRRELAEFPNIHFDRHVYQPLLRDDKRIEGANPPALNEGEEKFVRDLKLFLHTQASLLQGKEIFLLRNLTRGKGIGFFESQEGSSFYPDFILWMIDGANQTIVFVDPHGLRNEPGLQNNARFQLHQRLTALSQQLSAQTSGWKVVMTSFILATKTYDELRRNSWARDHPQAEFEKHHALFQDQHGEYVAKMLRAIGIVP